MSMDTVEFTFTRLDQEVEGYRVTFMCGSCEEEHHLGDVVRKDAHTWTVVKNLELRSLGSAALDADTVITADTAEAMEVIFRSRYNVVTDGGVMSQNTMSRFAGAQIQNLFVLARATGSTGGLVTALVRGIAMGFMEIENRPEVEEFIATVVQRLEREIDEAKLRDDLETSVKDAIKAMAGGARILDEESDTFTVPGGGPLQ